MKTMMNNIEKEERIKVLEKELEKNLRELDRRFEIIEGIYNELILLTEIEEKDV